MKRILTVFTLLLSSVLVFGEAFYIKHFDIQIDINEEGYFDVTETIDVFFTEKRRGIIRAIPRKVLIDGKKYSIKIKNIEVENWKKKAYKKDGMRMIRIGDKKNYLEGDQQYVISYRVYGAYLFLENHTEFHWNITGNYWDVPINKVTYNITFPNELNLEQEDFIAFSGKKNEQNNKSTIQYDNRTLSGESTKTLNPKEGITIAAKLPTDYIKRPPPPPPPVPFSERIPYLGVPLGLLGLIIAWWRNNGRRPKTSIADNEFEYYPPDDLSPSEVSAFFDRRPDTDDLVALIPMWARLGYLRVQGGNEDDGGLRFEKIEDLPSHAADYEHTVFNALFENNEIIFLPDLKEKLYTSMYTAKTQLAKNIKQKDYLFDRDSIRTFHSGTMLILGVLLLTAGIVTLIFTKGIVTGIIFIISSFVPIVIHFLRPKMSDEGEQMYLQIHRFKNFLKSDSTQNVDKLLQDDPNYFEKMLPYAVAFGLDNTFNQKFEHTEIDPPSWYIMGNSNLYATGASVSAFSHFSSQFQPTEIKQVFNSSPPASSSGGSGGGFSGGGGAGGGFGGGGGSSW